MSAIPEPVLIQLVTCRALAQAFLEATSKLEEEIRSACDIGQTSDNHEFPEFPGTPANPGKALTQKDLIEEAKRGDPVLPIRKPSLAPRTGAGAVAKPAANPGSTVVNSFIKAHEDR